jgi:hypothetical protein
MASKPLRLGAQVFRLRGPAAWWPTPALSGEEILRTLHLTSSGRLWMARTRLLLLRCGGGTSPAAAGAADGERGVLDSPDADMAPAGARKVGTPAAVRGGGHGAKAAPRSIDMVGPPTPDRAQILKLYDKLQHDTTLELYTFMKLDDKAVPTRGRSWMVRDACSSNRRRSTVFFDLTSMSVLWEGCDWI